MAKTIGIKIKRTIAILLMVAMIFSSDIYVFAQEGDIAHYSINSIVDDSEYVTDSVEENTDSSDLEDDENSDADNESIIDTEDNEIEQTNTEENEYIDDETEIDEETVESESIVEDEVQTDDGAKGNYIEVDEPETAEEIIENADAKDLVLTNQTGIFQQNTNEYNHIVTGARVKEVNNVISVWGSKCTYLIEGKKLSGNVHRWIANADNSPNGIVITGGSKEGRLDIESSDGVKYIIYNYESKEEFEYLYNMFHNKIVSVLGDSISTLCNNIPTQNQNHNIDIPYNCMYWGDIFTRFGAKQGVIEAWSASTIGSKYHAMSAWNRLNNLGKRGTPDILLYYGGSNRDRDYVAFDKNADYAKIVTSGVYSSLQEAYASSVNRIRYAYPNTLIVQIIPYYPREHIREEDINKMANHYNIVTVDLRKLMAREVIEKDNDLHPDKDGHVQIAEYICEILYQKQEDVAYELSDENRTISFDATTNGGLCDVDKLTVAEAVSANVVARKRACFFKGWYTQASGGVLVSGNDFNKIGFSTTLYAQFEPCEHLHLEKKGVKTPTFKSKGYTGYYYCKDCEEIAKEGEDIEPYSTTITRCEGSLVTDELLPDGWKWKDNTEGINSMMMKLQKI